MTLHGISAAEASIRRALLDGVSSRLIYEGNVCDSYPCWNDALCIPLNSSTVTYKCICQREYAGDRCQYRVADYCSSSSCVNGTVCTVQDGAVACVSEDLFVALDASLATPGMAPGSIFLLVSLSVLVLLSVMMICMGANAGCYLILPGETRYVRWETSAEDDDFPPADSAACDSIPLERINSIGLRNSQTTETVIDLDDGYPQ